MLLSLFRRTSAVLLPLAVLACQSERASVARDGFLWDEGASRWEPIRYAVVDGRAMIGDDVDLGSVAEMEALTRRLAAEKDAAIRPEALSLPHAGTPFWPNDTIPFEIDKSFEAQRTLVDSIMRLWEHGTTVRFVPKTAAHKVYVTISQSAKPTKCTTTYTRYVGGRVSKPATMALRPFCVGHELGHIIGLQHEHQRSDRNTYVTVRPPKGSEDQYEESDDPVCGPYDLGSIMHYDDFVDAKPGYTITRRDNVISPGDRTTVNSKYDGATCPPNTPLKPARQGGT